MSSGLKRPPQPDNKNNNDNDDDDDDDVVSKSVYHNTTIISPTAKRFKTDFQLRTLDISDGGKTNDEVYKRIPFCPVMKVLIDTPQMQRLRDIKQLGTAAYTYINANHTRFEHSIGVAHLAEAVGKTLQEHQPTLHITPKDILCIKLAGLLHDIGHGPFSHVFEAFYKEYQKHVPSELIQTYGPLPTKWSHEEASMMMIDAALEDLGLAIDLHHLDQPLRQIGDGVEATSMRVFTADDRTLAPNADNNDDIYHHHHRYGSNDIEASQPTLSQQAAFSELILTSRDWVFIKECIAGEPLPEVQETLGVVDWIGRPPDKEFLYDIVHNRHSGLDVDKLDYFARDRRRALAEEESIKCRLIDEALVAWAACPQPNKCFQCRHRPEGTGRHLMVCYPQKMAEDAMGFFKRRYDLHTQIYRHKTTTAAAYMIQDILTLANPYFLVPTTTPCSSSHAVVSPSIHSALPISHIGRNKIAYFNARDSIIHQIWHQNTPELQPAHKLIDRLQRRDLYKCSAVRRLDMDNDMDQKMWSMSHEEIRNGLLGVKGRFDGDRVTLSQDDIIVEKCDIHHGCGSKDPVAFCRFLPKDRLVELRKQVQDLPEAKAASGFDYTKPCVFQNNSIRVFCRGSPEQVQLLTAVFMQWEENFRLKVVTPDANPQFPPAAYYNGGADGHNNNHNNFAQRALPACSQESEDEYDGDNNDNDGNFYPGLY